jgi:ATP-dependent DNA helicase RecG
MVKAVDNILYQLQECLRTDTYCAIETDKVELKDLSAGDDWKELHKTVCAFLNTQGGIVIIGVKEKPGNAYQFHGFNPANEDKLKELPKSFTTDTGQPIDLTEYVRPDLFEIRPLMEGRVCILYVEKLPEDKKYVLYKGIAYERRLTGDHRIVQANIDRQRELRTELESVRELREVENATLDDLDIDALNNYIQRLNQGMKVETLKPDIASALSFLERKKFVVKGKPTLLGMLVCGHNIYDFVGGRCQVDGFVESPVQIAGNKKIYKDNIIPLLESSIGFVYANIATGISAEKGGTAIFEYPERLIRETVNNALAHRDYSVDKFVNITINPGKYIEIRNPGAFRREQMFRIDADIPIRRIIPIPKAQNPRLADVLKAFDRWEGKGWGMSSLTNVALDNQVDLPYYMLYAQQDIGLVIPRGKILDEEMEEWLNSFEGYIFRKTNGQELTEEQRTALAYFYKSERLNRQERYTIALTPDNNHFSVITDLEQWNLIFRHPNSPDLYPIFFVDRVLLKLDFIDELRAIYGGDYDNLARNHKDVMNIVYHFNTYGKTAKDINATQIGDMLYFRQHRNIVDVKKYSEFKQNIRRVVKQLTDKQFLIKSAGSRPTYIINKNYERTASVFDE